MIGSNTVGESSDADGPRIRPPRTDADGCFAWRNTPQPQCYRHVGGGRVETHITNYADFGDRTNENRPKCRPALWPKKRRAVIVGHTKKQQMVRPIWSVRGSFPQTPRGEGDGTRYRLAQTATGHMRRVFFWFRCIQQQHHPPLGKTRCSDPEHSVVRLQSLTTTASAVRERRPAKQSDLI